MRRCSLALLLGLTLCAAASAQQGPVSLDVQAPPYSFLAKPFTMRFKLTCNGPAVRSVRVQYPVADIYGFQGQQGGFTFDQRVNAAVWSVGNLEPGQSVGAELTLVGRRAGKVNPCAELSYALVQTVCPPLEVRAIPALVVTNEDDPDPIEIGAMTTYTITAANQSDGADVEDLVIRCEIPAEMEFVSATGPQGIGSRVVDGACLFDPVPRLAPKQRISYQVRMRGVREGDVVQRTHASFKGFSKPILDEEGTTVYGK